MTSHDTNRKAAIRWGSFVVGLLGLQVALGVWAVVLATGDQSAVIVPNYYEKALRWDEQASSREASKSLGWELSITERDNDLPASSLRISLTDADGDPVSIRSGTVTIYHHATADNIVSTVIKPSSNTAGTLDWLGCVAQGGWWQIDVDAVDPEGNRFVESRQVKLIGPSSTPVSASGSAVAGASP